MWFSDGTSNSLDNEDGRDLSRKRKLRSEDGMNVEEIEDEDEGAEAMISLENADEKARNTAVSVPFLLSRWVKLRKYQQIGLNWLVSIQTRRFLYNSIKR